MLWIKRTYHHPPHAHTDFMLGVSCWSFGVNAAFVLSSPVAGVLFLAFRKTQYLDAPVIPSYIFRRQTQTFGNTLEHSVSPECQVSQRALGKPKCFLRYLALGRHWALRVFPNSHAESITFEFYFRCSLMSLHAALKTVVLRVTWESYFNLIPFPRELHREHHLNDNLANALPGRL